MKALSEGHKHSNSYTCAQHGMDSKNVWVESCSLCAYLEICQTGTLCNTFFTPSFVQAVLPGWYRYLHRTGGHAVLDTLDLSSTC